jgi:hypothetical protein
MLLALGEAHVAHWNFSADFLAEFGFYGVAAPPPTSCCALASAEEGSLEGTLWDALALLKASFLFPA